jgi:peptidoglycan/xylan/chitin deacetylase (PgdA/CDA1 family)
MTALPLKATLRYILSRRQRSAIIIQTYHRVTISRDHLEPGWPTADEFKRQISWLKNNTTVIDLVDYSQKLDSKDSEGILYSAITFDDGYLDNALIAAPILKALNVKATFFIATVGLDAGHLYSDTIREAIRKTNLEIFHYPPLFPQAIQLRSSENKRLAVSAINTRLKRLDFKQRTLHVRDIAEYLSFSHQSRLTMSSAEVQGLVSAGHGIGAHSHLHVIPTSDSLEFFTDDALTSKRQLESITNTEVKMFAYPNGKPSVDFNDTHRAALVSVGYKAAFSSENKVAIGTDDRLSIPRFSIWGQNKLRWQIDLLRGVLKRTKSSH